MKKNYSAKKKGGWKRVVLIVACVLLSLILLLLIGVGLVLKGLFGGITIKDPNQDVTLSPEEASSLAMNDWETVDPDDTSPIVNPDDIIIDNTGGELEQGSHVVNIMLVGQDAREGEGTQRSDSMILITFNKSKKAITLTSFMRDEFVNIPGYGTTKLNHAYQYGGMNLMNQTLYNYYGLQIHGNVEVDFSNFAKIIDMLGGVTIDLTEKEVAYMNAQEGWDLSPGRQRLSGEVALRYSRIRQIDTDYARTERQRKVLLSIMNEYKTQSLPKMLELLEEILPMITTNMSKNQIMDYVVDMFGMVAGAEINTMRLPVDGTFEEGYVRVAEGMKLWCQYNIDFEANRKILQELFEE